MLSRDSYPSNIASLLLSWPYLCLLLASLKSHKNQGTHRKLRLYQHWSYFLWWQARQLFILMPQMLLMSNGHYVHRLLIFLWISPLCHQDCFQVYISKHWFGKWRERKPYWFVATVVHCCSWKTDQKGGEHMKTQRGWRDATLPGTLTYYHKKMWHQFGSRQAASGLLWGEELHSNNAGEETHLLKWLWPLTSDCTASVCCYCYEDRWCPHDIGLMIQVMGRVKPFVVIVNSGSYVVQAWCSLVMFLPHLRL